MRNKHMIRTLAVLLAVMLCMTAFSTVAFASDGETATTSEAQTEPTDSADITGDDLSELISALFGSIGTEKSGKTGIVTTNGGKLNVRTGAGLDNYAFTQLPNGTVVEVVGTDGDWYMVRLPEKIGYVYSGYMTLSDTGGQNDSSFSFSIDPDKLSELFEQLMGGSGGAALTPDGNLSLIDDIGGSTRSGKQFITVETKNGNVFYLIIDRDDEGEETVHFLNQVDEADLLTLMGDDAPAAETPAVCNCKEKCVAGAVNTNCPVCKNNLSECSGKEAAAEPEPEAEQPEKKSSGGLLVIVLLLALAGGGAFAYVKFIKPKQGMKVSADPDDYDFEDEEMVNEDELEDTELNRLSQKNRALQNLSRRPWVLHPGPKAFMRATNFLYLGAWDTWYPRWMRAAMTSVSRNGAMMIFPFCRSHFAMCWHQARRTHLKIYAP